MGRQLRSSVVVTLLLGLPQLAHADSPSLSISRDADLRFGKFAVFDTGWRAITPSGTQTSSGIMSAGNDPVGPAQFTVRFDRGIESARPLTVTFQLLLQPQATAGTGGVKGQLSDFSTDLPGALPLVPGTIATASIANCRTRVCTLQFSVGARIDVTRSWGGSQTLTFALPVTALLVSAF